MKKIKIIFVLIVASVLFSCSPVTHVVCGGNGDPEVEQLSNKSPEIEVLRDPNVAVQAPGTDQNRTETEVEQDQAETGPDQN